MPESRRSTRSSGAARSSSTAADDYFRQARGLELHPASRRPSIDGMIDKPGRHAGGVKRWDGNRRMTTEWDCLRRDPELWFPDGDCLIHLYARGQSRRGPSFRLPLAQLASSQVFVAYGSRPDVRSPQSAESGSSSDRIYFGNPPTVQARELYIPAPARLSPGGAFRYHLTTRNVFASILGRPVVGTHLGQALIDLLERMNTLNLTEDDHLRDILVYMEDEGYGEFRECPDHALAVLIFAEHFELQGLWTDAFVHCAGMNNRLTESGEFEAVSRVTKALMMRTRLETDLRLEHAGRSLSTFLEDDLSAAYLGLGNGPRVHLDRFRSFLHSFYVGRYGYWPPPINNASNVAFSQSAFRSMYFDFRSLYQYLVDTESTTSLQDQKPADGGLCVFQNVTAFDRRHGYASLPHPHPLVPECAKDLTPRSAASLDVLKIGAPFGRRKARKAKRIAAIAALSAATNSEDVTVMDCPLVREYMWFEKAFTLEEKEKVSLAEARKVRWILIYTILQVLVSVNKAPIEVRDTGGVSYPLCFQNIGKPPWKTSSRAQASEEREDEIEIMPDAYYLTIRSGSTKSPKVTPKYTASPAPTLNMSHNLSVRSPQPLRASSSALLEHGHDKALSLIEIDSDSNSS
ncbi:MAG: hypothetical protein M1830_003566, partial [Pleopsidium flavum]